ncbi:uncharacterized protein C4orf51 homolog isoform 3-T5 [Lycaon pictus]
MCFEGQTQHLISSPNSSAFNPIVCRADSRESTDAKGLFPQIMNSFKNSHDVKHSVSHQLLLFPMHTKFCLVVFLQHLQIMKNHV